MSVLFLFYGLLFGSGAIEVYDGPVWKVFGGIFVTGGFMFSFGQFVPSWDSSYYNLMMSQNIQYREYLSSKWWLMVIVTLIAAVFASFYLYFGWKAYLLILVTALYNIGINAYIVLLAGAYTKTPIDLMSNKNAFGDKKAFNIKTLLLIIPQILIPLGLYYLGILFFDELAGLGFIALAGILGFAFKSIVFNWIENIYKTQKYETISAYKQKN
jgi:multisubunit Na+/H+ antiporter MnhC subunit